ncbi:hypothetical protein OIU77_027906 [Salix suchowensis]|uniref:BED-type domain-containing protein n=1 Tax=Salix suchowensis TaxID=1278906 RepID=A0ABQ9BSX2_9ROSI|nr:hypothetical protein OIU77_027906 [Salix suchowensis]
MLFFCSVPPMIKVAVPTCVEPASAIPTALTSTRKLTLKLFHPPEPLKIRSWSPIPASLLRSVKPQSLLAHSAGGQVKGWTVVEPAREYLNAKKRSCMQDDCSFNGTYKELRKHMKTNHPSARPRAVDPSLEQKWRRLEREREHDDVISTIRSTMPGAMVFGDYVIEGSHYGFDTDEDGGVLMQMPQRGMKVLRWASIGIW